MSDHCPQDGGFIGKAGCTHPNHQHSELVKKLIADAANPKMISPRDASSALQEGFYVKNPAGTSVGFGQGLLNHVEGHLKQDADNRKQRLLFAVNAVTNPDRMEKDHKGAEGRTLYVKAFEKFGMLVVSEKDGDTIEDTFTIFPNRKGKKRK